MVSIFIAPGRADRVKRGVIDGVELRTLRIEDERLRETLQKSYLEDKAYLWGLRRTRGNEAQWVKVNSGDYLLFYITGMKIFEYCSKVLFTYPFNLRDEKQLREAEGIAEATWGRDERGDTWSLLMFIEKGIKIDMTIRDFKELTGYRLAGGARIFFKVGEDKVQRLLRHIEALSR